MSIVVDDGGHAYANVYFMCYRDIIIVALQDLS